MNQFCEIVVWILAHALNSTVASRSSDVGPIGTKAGQNRGWSSSLSRVTSSKKRHTQRLRDLCQSLEMNEILRFSGLCFTSPTSHF